MDVDHILRTFDTHGVEFLLIGGMNFLLRHEPVLTYRGLCDEDMIACQLALPVGQRRAGRIETLERAIRSDRKGP
jgi:hypothetical protein